MVDKKQSNWLDKHRVLTVICVTAVLLAIVAVSSMIPKNEQNTKKPVDKMTSLTLGAEKAGADLLKSYLDLYYTVKGSYPVNYRDFISTVNSDQSGYLSNISTKTLDEIRGELKDFSYTVRGDGQACQLTYTNSLNEPVTVAIDYKNEYH